MGQSRYLYVFRPHTGPEILFREFSESYRRAAEKLGWMTVACDFDSWVPERKDWYDPDAVIVFWNELPPVIPAGRKAKVALHYIESVPTGDPGKLIGPQREWLERHMKRAKEVDLFLIGTPSAKLALEPFCPKVALMPVGYSPEVMGVPDWTRPKVFDIGFCGTIVGRREWILPVLRRKFGPRLLEISPQTRVIIEHQRNAALSFCRASLYVGHSEDIGVGLRLWQTLATSSALVTEERDAWPAVSGRHYVEVPHARMENPDALVDSLEQVLKLPLADIAMMAYNDLSKYTPERCFEEFLVPAIDSVGAVPAQTGEKA